MSCFEKIKVLNENYSELLQLAQDVLEDGILMGCSEAQMREVFHRLIDTLINPYGERDRAFGGPCRDLSQSKK